MINCHVCMCIKKNECVHIYLLSWGGVPYMYECIMARKKKQFYIFSNPVFFLSEYVFQAHIYREEKNIVDLYILLIRFYMSHIFLLPCNPHNGIYHSDIIFNYERTVICSIHIDLIIKRRIFGLLSLHTIIERSVILFAYS